MLSQALRYRGRQDAQSSGVDMRLRARYQSHIDLHVPGQEGRLRLRGRAIGHVRHANAGELREHLRAQMRRRPGAGGCVVDLVGVRFGVAHQLGQGLHRQLGIRINEQRHIEQHAERIEGGERNVRQLYASVKQALGAKDVLARIALDAAEPVGSTPEAFRLYLVEEVERYAKLVKLLGLKAD